MALSNRERQARHRARRKEAALADAGQIPLIPIPKPKPGRPKSDNPKTPAQRQREYRQRKKAAALPIATPVGPWPKHPALAVAEWSAENLIVPPGHPLGGQPMRLPDYGVRFLADALQARESLLSVGRKNAKSAIVATYLLARLAGPLRQDGYRAGVISVTKEKAGELKRLMLEIAEASGLAGLRFLRSPAPGRVESPAGTVDILAADSSAGHSSGFSETYLDELGLLDERHRGLVDGMMSSLSARDGRMISLSIQGHSPFTAELLDRRHSDQVAVHHYAAPADCALDDRSAWEAANPGLAEGIKSYDYMADAARRAEATPLAQSNFKAHELNQRVAALDRETIIPPSVWRTGDAPREGPAMIGIDLGGSRSMSAVAIYWPASGRIECYGAFAETPPLSERGRTDGVGDEYLILRDRGELRTYPGRVVPVGQFLADVLARLDGIQIELGGADRYRQAETMDALAAARVALPSAPHWRMTWRGTGAGAKATGSADIRAFQRRAYTRRLIAPPGAALLQQAITESALRHDGAGNPALDKSRTRGRIDALQASVIAAGLSDEFERRQRGGGFAFA